MLPRNVLAIAVASGKAGYVYLSDRKLNDWGITVKATKSDDEIGQFAQTLIDDLNPEVVVTEKCDDQSRKGENTRALIQAIAATASNNHVYDIAVPRPRRFPSKYEEAAYLAERYLDIAGYLPKQKRRIYEFEPRGMIIFEALALAEAVIYGPPEALAAAMG